ncbi:MAG: MerR family transcriptional regulator [Nocardioides sp.]
MAAELTGLHPQTLRSYERLGLITPGRTGGGGRRYSHSDIELLRTIADLTASGIGIEGVRRILQLQNQVEALQLRNTELQAELEGRSKPCARHSPVGVCRRRRPATRCRCCAPRTPDGPSRAIVVWRRGSR